MANPETDKLGLATNSTLTGGFLFFGPTVRLDTGFSLEVFRKSGEYLGSVAYRDASDPSQAVRRLGAHDGDQVVRVNLGEHPLTVSGTLATRDGYSRAYEALMYFRVTNASAFAVAYRQGTDPVLQARLAIDAELVRWAEWMEHDQITPAAARFRASMGLNQIKRTIGLSVTRVERVSPAEDPHHAALRKAQQQAIVDQGVARATQHTERVRITEQDATAQVQHGFDVRKQEEERDRLRSDHALQLDLDELSAQHQLRADARQKLTATIVEQQQKRIRELLDAGYSLQQIEEEEPDLMHGVQELLSTTNAASDQGTRMRQLPPGTPASATSQTDDAFVKPGTVRQPTEATEIYSPRLALAVTQQNLSPEQMTWVSKRLNPPPQTGSLVGRIDPGGPAQRAGLQIGDFLLLIDGKPCATAPALDALLEAAAQRDGIARVTALRGQEARDIPVQIGR